MLLSLQPLSPCPSSVSHIKGEKGDLQVRCVKASVGRKGLGNPQRRSRGSERAGSLAGTRRGARRGAGSNFIGRRKVARLHAATGPQQRERGVPSSRHPPSHKPGKDSLPSHWRHGGGHGPEKASVSLKCSAVQWDFVGD